MRAFLAATIVAVSLALLTSAHAETSIKCQKIEDVPAAEAGWKLVGVRRPTISGSVTIMSLQVFMPIKFARNNADEKGKIIKIDECGFERDNVVGEKFVGYKVWANLDGDFNTTEIPLPEDAKGVRVMSCSPTEGKCWEAIFDGDASKWVTLQPQQKAPEMVGKYN